MYLLISAVFLLSANAQDVIPCNGDADCPDEKPYCDAHGECSWCLPPDSVPPSEAECKHWVDESNGQPYYVPHLYNCSRFWECETNYRACLFECAPCPPNMCPEDALFFNPAVQYPDGPVCDWPSNIDCTNRPVRPLSCPLPCQQHDPVTYTCSPECCNDGDCPNERPLCNQDVDGGTCQDGCRVPADCENFDGICPACQWCDKPGNNTIGNCEPGCTT